MEQLIEAQPIIEVTVDNIDKFGDQKSSFEMFFLQAVDEAFSMLGNQSSELMYSYLENKYGIKKENIPKNVELFSQAIEGVFGNSARLLEIKIMRSLHLKVPAFIYSNKESAKLSFVNYVEALHLYL